MPTAPSYYDESELPSHPCLGTVANCEQILCSKYGRRLVIMEKVDTYNEEKALAHWRNVGSPQMKLDQIRDHVYSAEDGLEDALLHHGNKQTMKRNKHV